MEYMKDWLNNIAVYMVLTMFVNVLIPSKAYKKYINLVLGFILILLVLAPINKLLHNSDSFIEDKIANQKMIIDKEQVKMDQLQVDNENKKAILKIFKNNTEDQIKNLLLQNMNVRILKLDLDIGEGEDDTGEVKQIKITVAQNKNYFSNDSTKELNKEIVEEKIKTLLKNFYNIDENNIYVQG